ncbi:MAG TPA: chloride channel protein [Polyangia bacterium]
MAESDAQLVSRRVVWLSFGAIAVAAVAAVVARGLVALIDFVTNLAFYGRLSVANVSPAGNHLGLWVILIPVVGGLIVGLMARFWSQGIRGHGIPEAIERVLFAESRVPKRLTFLKPLSAALAIGTGGPFGAEGPIIATGGALGSLLGQLFPVTAEERKTLLAAGAAAGMAATFGTPVASVLLAIELLLFEYRPRSIIPVALAAATATAVRVAFVGSAPMFALEGLTQPRGGALAFYVALGAVTGVAAVWVTRAVYAAEDLFGRLPIHWMWWPAIGALVVGVIGFFAPRTMGVGYDNIREVLSGTITGRALYTLGALKLVSWAVALGSGTSGGTLAPLFTIGGALGAALTAIAHAAAPGLGVDVRIGALVGMAAIFAGASRALLASVVFAFEATRQPLGLLPLLGGCTAAFLVSSLWMKTTIMTEKIVRHGNKVPAEYLADFLELLYVRDFVSTPVVALRSDERVDEARAFISSDAPGARHQGFPVIDEKNELRGVVTRRNLLAPEVAGDTPVGEIITRPPTIIFDDDSLREAAERMAQERIGRLPVVTRKEPRRVIGMLTRSDILGANRRRLAARRIER